MFKNKWLWALLTLCCFILAGFAAKGQMSSPQSLTANTAITAQGQAVAQKAATSSASLETEKIKGDRAVALSGDVEMPVIARGEEARRMYTNLEEAVPAGMMRIPDDVVIPRAEEFNLDDACQMINGNTANWLQTQTVATTTYYWVDPLDCPTNPGYPFKIQNMNYLLYNPAVAGSFVYRVHIVCPAAPADYCSGPGNVLWTSTNSTVAMTAGQALTRTHIINGATGLCVNGPFFVAIETVSFTGAGTWPAPVFSGTVEAEPCTQWRCVAGVCTEWTQIGFSFSGVLYATTNGNTHDVCTPVPCTPTEACDVVCTGTPEGEPTCANEYVDVTNAGCNVDPPVYGSIDCGETVCGTSGTYLVGTANSRDSDWYEVSFAQTNQITWCARGEFPVQVLVIQPGGAGVECDELAIVGAATARTCSTACVTMNVTPGTYWLWVGPSVFTGIACGVEYEATLSCTPVVCTPDFTTNISCAGASTPIQGNTTGANDPCAIGIESHLWQLNVTEPGLYSFSGCGGPAQYDQYLVLYDQAGCCATPLCFNDDSCGTQGSLSVIECCDLGIGTYYLSVRGFAAGNVGQYAINVTCCAPCEVVCTNNEGEPQCGDDYDDVFNSGCAGTTEAFSAISCGQTVCGASGTFLVNGTDNYRDTDWYEVTITESMTLTWTWNAEFFATCQILSSPCATASVLRGGTSEPCSTGTLSACVDVGTYYLLITPSVFTGVPCGASYEVTLTCEPCEIISTCDPNAAFSQGIDTPADDWTFGVSDIQGELHRFEDFSITAGTAIGSIGFWGVTTMGSTFDACLEQPMTFEISAYPDLAGEPDFTTGPTCRDTVNITGAPSGFVYHSTLQLPAYYYELTYAEGLCCSLTAGWIGVKGLSAGAPDDCRFLWGSSGGSAGGSSLLYDTGVLSATETFNLAMCINACPVPCDPVPHTVTVYRNSTAGVPHGYVTLRWTAPQAGTYLIYKSTVTTNDGDADGADADALPGDDTDWTLADSPVVVQGDVSWDAPAGFDPYANYIIYHQCW